MALMSQREYARHRGVSHVAVAKAIKTGRIVEAVKSGKIDWELADKLWLRNTDQSKPRNSISGDPKRRRASPDEPPMPAYGRQPVPELSPKQAEAVQRAIDAGANGGQDAGIAVPLPEGETPAAPTGKTGYIEARTSREHFQSLLARLDFEQKSGQLVKADMVRMAAFKVGRQARDMLQGIPDRLAAILAGEADQFQVHKILTDEVRNVCNAIATATPDPDGA
jgi:hypothetical protein